MDPIPPITIPDAYIKFAKSVAAIAEQNDIKSFQLKIAPDFHRVDFSTPRINGDVIINYSSVDGRGRPCVNLDVHLNASTLIQVVKNAESFG